jgi:hypothetical protein
VSTALKIGVGCLIAVVLVVALAAGGGFYWWRNYGAGMVEGMKHTVEEGQQYGRGADEWKCLNEALARYKRDGGMTGGIKARIFLKSCLQPSGAAAGFCDGVPSRSEIMRTVEWRIDKCEGAGLGSDRMCTQLFEEVQEYCDSDEARGKRRPEATPEEEATPTPTPTPRRRARP